MVHSPIVQISNYPTVQQSSCPKSNCPDFQTCNVRFIESDGKAQRDSCAKDERTGSGMVVDPKICVCFHCILILDPGPSVTVQNTPTRENIPQYVWPRQNIMVIDLFTYTFEHYQFHHKLINAIDGCILCQTH